VGRRDGVEERLGRRGAATVVAELEHVGAQARSEQRGLFGALGVAREDDRAAAIVEAQHDRAVVHAPRERGGGGGAEDLDREVRPQRDRARPHDARVERRQRREDPGVDLAAIAGPPDLADRHRARDRREPAGVIGVGVREHHDIQPIDAPRPQERHDHPPRARVVADVDRDRAPIGQLYDRAVALPHRQVRDPQDPLGGVRRPGPGDRCQQRAGDGQAAPSSERAEDRREAQRDRQPLGDRRPGNVDRGAGDGSRPRREREQPLGAPPRDHQERRAQARRGGLEQPAHQRKRHQNERSERRRGHVGEDADQRDAPEVHRHQRRGGQRRRERGARDRERHRPHARQPRRPERGEVAIDHQQTEQRAERELERRIGQRARAPGQERQRRDRHAGRRVRSTAAEVAEQHDEHHHRGAHRRGLAADERGVERDQRHRQERARPARPESEGDASDARKQAPQADHHHARDDRQVEAAHRHQV